MKNFVSALVLGLFVGLAMGSSESEPQTKEECLNACRAKHPTNAKGGFKTQAGLECMMACPDE